MMHNSVEHHSFRDKKFNKLKTKLIGVLLDAGSLSFADHGMTSRILTEGLECLKMRCIPATNQEISPVKTDFKIS